MKTLVPLCLQVLQDWRVIAITVFFVLYISLANYVVRYRKKPHVPRQKHIPVQEKPAEEKKEGEGAAE